jgi:hypothetical protein
VPCILCGSCRAIERSLSEPAPRRPRSFVKSISQNRSVTQYKVGAQHRVVLPRGEPKRAGRAVDVRQAPAYRGRELGSKRRHVRRAWRPRGRGTCAEIQARCHSSAATSACASAIRLLSDGFAWPRQNACYCRAAKCGRRERNNSAQSGSHWTRVRACNKSNPLRFLTSINPIRFAGWQHALRSAFSFSVETATRRRVSNEAAVDPRAGRRAGDRRSIGRKARHRSDPRSRSVSARRHARFARCRTIRTKATRRDESKRVLCLSEIKLAVHMMESAKKWRRHNSAKGIYCSRHRRVFVELKGACEPRYRRSHKIAADGEDAARRTRQRGQGIPCGSNRSAFRHTRSAKGSVAT